MAASKSIVELFLLLLLTGFLALLSRFFDLRFDGVAEVIGADGLAALATGFVRDAEDEDTLLEDFLGEVIRGERASAAAAALSFFNSRGLNFFTPVGCFTFFCGELPPSLLDAAATLSLIRSRGLNFTVVDSDCFTFFCGEARTLPEAAAAGRSGRFRRQNIQNISQSQGISDRCDLFCLSRRGSWF